MSRLFFARTALRATVPSGVTTTSPSFVRSFSSLPGLRPSTIQPSPVFSSRPTTSAFFQSRFAPASSSPIAAEAADLVPTSAISAHPALMQSQIRCGPRRHMNMNRPSRLIRQRRHGFLSRIRTKTGRKMLARRHSKQRKTLSA